MNICFKHQSGQIHCFLFYCAANSQQSLCSPYRHRTTEAQVRRLSLLAHKCYYIYTFFQTDIFFVFIITTKKGFQVNKTNVI